MSAHDLGLICLGYNATVLIFYLVNFMVSRYFGQLHNLRLIDKLDLYAQVFFKSLALFCAAWKKADAIPYEDAWNRMKIWCKVAVCGDGLMNGDCA